ncbi:F-box/kelch-repeat protein SKIP11 [Capsicum chinense]|nr:F-box/kelch-repeat protein SKIP11 [Capsicum chinense]
MTRRFGDHHEVSELEVCTLGVDEKWRNLNQVPYSCKGLFGLLDESARPPIDAKELDLWKLNNAKVISWMLNSVHANIAMGLRPFSLASEMWTHIRTVYQQSNLTREFELERNIAKYTLGDKNVHSFYDGLLLLWLEQDQILRQNISKAGLKEVLEEQKKTRVVQFLMKLRPEFESIHGILLNREVTPALDVVLVTVLREETRLGSQAAMDFTLLPSVSLLVGKSTIVASTKNNKRSVNVMNAKTLVMSQPIVLRKTILCLLQNYWQSYFRLSSLPKSFTNCSSYQTNVPTSSGSFLVGTSNSIKSTWHLNLEASNHMIGDLSQFSSLSSDVSKHVIHTANRHTLPASGIGSTGYLFNVLYVPNLKANLILAGQLVDQNCVIKFSPNGCVIQNLKIGMIMATVHRFGIMFLQESVHCHLHHCFLSVSLAGVTLSDKLLTLWHNRMGPPHFSRLHHMLKSCTNYAVATDPQLESSEPPVDYDNGDLQPLSPSSTDPLLESLEQPMNNGNDALQPSYLSNIDFTWSFSSSKEGSSHPVSTQTCWKEAIWDELCELNENSALDFVDEPTDGVLIRKFLHTSFKIKDLGRLMYFLGIEVLYLPTGIMLTQQKYDSDLVATASLTDDKVVYTQMEANTKYKEADGEPFSDPTLYRQLVGSLVYLTMTRIDILYATQVLSQFVANPYRIHHTALLCVIWIEVQNGKRPLEDDQEVENVQCRLQKQSDGSNLVEVDISLWSSSAYPDEHADSQAHDEQDDNQNHAGDNSDRSTLFPAINRDSCINSLIRCTWSHYGAIASLNLEHWVYFSCQQPEWEAFDPARLCWMHLPRMTPNNCFVFSDKESLAVGTELLVFRKDVFAHVIYQYSLLTNTWSTGMQMNVPRCLFGKESLGEIAIFAGGCDSQGKILSSAELYNSETGTWRT